MPLPLFWVHGDVKVSDAEAISTAYGEWLAFLFSVDLPLCISQVG